MSNIISKNLGNNEPLSPPSFHNALQVRHQLGSAFGKTRQRIISAYEKLKNPAMIQQYEAMMAVLDEG